MKTTIGLGFTLVTAAMLAGGCSSDGTPLTLSTSSIGQQADAAAKPKLDPQCVALGARIEGLRKEGFAERVEKASVGKSSNVTVKREALAKMTELDKANAEFQAKCGTVPFQQAAVAPAQATPTAAPQSPVSGAAGAQAAKAAPSAASAAVAPLKPSTPSTTTASAATTAASSPAAQTAPAAAKN
ncbi:MAG: hypothetical protein NW216_14360 [Hyphomicrobium sp.]|nr:hypothetical protein [Hyphomicrobium sp.]